MLTPERVSDLAKGKHEISRKTIRNVSAVPSKTIRVHLPRLLRGNDSTAPENWVR